MEALFDSFPSELNNLNLCEARSDLDARLNIEESFWNKKTNIKWIREGDHNTRYFQQTVNKRRQRLYLHQIKGIDGQLLFNHKDI